MLNKGEKEVERGEVVVNYIFGLLMVPSTTPTIKNRNLVLKTVKTNILFHTLPMLKSPLGSGFNYKIMIKVTMIFLIDLSQKIVFNFSFCVQFNRTIWLFFQMLSEKESKWMNCQKESITHLNELSSVFSGGKQLARVDKNGKSYYYCHYQGSKNYSLILNQQPKVWEVRYFFRGAKIFVNHCY